MSEETRNCYDRFAPNYHLMFEDWEASMARQAAALGPILERACGESRTLRILDCACGIGTQALGLAKRGHRITGCDLSPAAVGRARAEARNRGLEMQLFVADMRDLAPIPDREFDAVVCLDNALPHLDGREQLLRAAGQIRMKLPEGGTFLASIRDYDHLVLERPVVHGPAFFSDQGRRRMVHQVWDWIDDRRYTFHLYITRQTDAGWDSHHCAATYCAVLRDELTEVLGDAGFTGVRWLFPAESGFYQPLLLAKAG
jgi:glycine/sarcosine N-methyltransferase